MTLSTTQHYITYVGNGTACEFPIPFLFFEAGDIAVSLQTGECLPVTCAPSAYRVEGMQSPQGGTLIFGMPPAEGQTVKIIRRVPLLQNTSWKNHERIDAGVLERQFDRVMMGLQQLSPSVERSLQVEVEGQAVPPTLHAPTGQAGKLLMVDDTERHITYYDASAVTTAGLYPKEVFSCDGVGRIFPLRYPAASGNSLLVVLNRQIQEPGVDYRLVGRAIECLTVPKAGTANLYIIHLAATQHVAGVSDASITAEKLAPGSVLPNPELRQFSQTVQALSVIRGEAVMNLTLASVWTLTLTQDTVLKLVVPPDINKNYGCKLLLTTADKSYMLSWPSNVKWPYGQAPAFKGLMQTHLLYVETFDGGNNWYAALSMEAMR